MKLVVNKRSLLDKFLSVSYEYKKYNGDDRDVEIIITDLICYYSMRIFQLFAVFTLIICSLAVVNAILSKLTLFHINFPPESVFYLTHVGGAVNKHFISQITSVMIYLIGFMTLMYFLYTTLLSVVRAIKKLYAFLLTEISTNLTITTEDKTQEQTKE